jgi:hypothetical protein
MNEAAVDSDDYDIQVAKPGTAAKCDELVDSLSRLSSVMRDDETRQPPPPEDVRIASKSKPLMAPLLLSLFSTMSKYCRCTCKPHHQAALLLNTNRTLPKDDSPASFTLLLSRESPIRQVKRWQEAGIAVCEQLYVIQICHHPEVHWGE